MKYSAATSIALAAMTVATATANSIIVTTVNGVPTTISHPSSVYSSPVATPTPTAYSTTSGHIVTVTATPSVSVRPYPVCIVYVSEAPGVTVPVTTWSSSRGSEPATSSPGGAATTYSPGATVSSSRGSEPATSSPGGTSTTYSPGATASSYVSGGLQIASSIQGTGATSVIASRYGSVTTKATTVTATLVTRSALTSITATIYTTSAGQVTTVYPTGYHGSIPSSLPYCNGTYPAYPAPPAQGGTTYSIVTVPVVTPSSTLLSSNEADTVGNAQNALGKSGASMLKGGASVMFIGLAAGIAAVAL